MFSVAKKKKCRVTTDEVLESLIGREAHFIPAVCADSWNASLIGGMQVWRGS